MTAAELFIIATLAACFLAVTVLALSSVIKSATELATFHHEWDARCQREAAISQLRAAIAANPRVA